MALRVIKFIPLILLALVCWMAPVNFPAHVRHVETGSTTNQLTVTNNMLAWWKADAQSFNEGDAVGTWTDSSGNSRDLTQSTAYKKPTYRTNQLNSLPGIVFDGTATNTMQVAYDISGTNTMSMFIVIKSPSSFAVGGTIDEYSANYNSNNAWRHGFNSTESISGGHHTASGYNAWTNVVSTSTHYYVTYVHNMGNAAASEVVARINGSVFQVQTSSANNSGNWSNSTLYFGSRAGTSTSASGLNLSGTIYEVIWYSDAKGSTDITSIENYLKTKYGL